MDNKKILRIKQKSLHCKLGSDLLSRGSGQSTISAVGFHFRVRNGIECFTHAITTKLAIQTF